MLAENVPERALFDIVIRCHHCGGLNRSPGIPAHVPVPQHTVLFEDEELDVLTVDLGDVDGDVAIASRPAVERWWRRVERTRRKFFAARGTEIASAELCSSLQNDVRRLLGPVWDVIALADERGRASPTPAPAHRLAELMRAAQDVERELSKSTRATDLSSIAEVNLIVHLMEHWEDDPAWPEMRAGLVHQDSFAHTISTLAAATFLIAHGNPGALYATAGRAADLRLDVSPLQHVVTEVKAPRLLRAPLEPITEELALRVVEKARRKAGTGARGQLSPRQSGVLLIGGFSLREGDLDALAAAAQTVLDAKIRAHLMGIVIVSVGTVLYAAAPGRGVNSIIDVRVATNRQYSGAHSLETSQGAQPARAHLAQGLSTWAAHMARASRPPLPIAVEKRDDSIWIGREALLLGGEAVAQIGRQTGVSISRGTTVL